MKVLQINAVYGIGSTGTIVEDIHKLFLSKNIESFIAYSTSNRRNDEIINGYKIGGAIGKKMHALLSRISGKQAYFSSFATRKFLKHVEKISPDVVILHNLHSNYINLNMLLKFLAKRDIATVILLHDCWFFTGKCFHYIDVGCDRFKNGCGKCPKVKVAPQSLFFDTSKQVLKDKTKYLTAIPRLTVVGVSDWVANETKNSSLCNSEIIRIYNGIDTQIFKPQNRKELKAKFNLTDKKVIMGIANKWLLPENELAFKKIYDSLDDGAILLVGCNDAQKQQMRAYPKIIPIDFITDRAVLSQYYAASDVFVNLTHADTLPTVNMESICCGTPVVTYNCSGSPELVLEGCGRVVEENDVDALLSAIEQALKMDRDVCAEVGAANFDKTKTYEEYISLCERLKAGDK